MPSSSPSPSPPAPLVQSPVKRQSSSQKRNSDQYESANSGTNSVESSSGSAGVGGEKTPLSSNVTESRRRSNFNVVPIQAQDMRDFGPYQHIKKGSMGGANQMSNGTPRGRAGSNSTGGSNSNSNKSTSPIGQQHQQLAVPLLPRNGNGNHQNMLNNKRSSAVSANSAYSSYPSHSSHEKSPGGGGAGLVWDSKDPEMDDYLHNPDPIKDKKRDCGWSTRGLVNVAAMSIVITGLLALFAGYPLISHFTEGPSDGTAAGFNIGGTNGSGQVPDIPNLAQLIDPDTPPSAQTYKSSVSGDSFHIVFSDEFETEGRTFWPGDDPYWEAVDLWYGGTGDYEWYSPEAVNTTGGALVIEMTEQATHNLNFQSGMVQSWNKFCFTGGYLEFSAILPGNVGARGYWPGLWTMGNLGRPGYLGSTDGMWPYSYNSCDTGTLKNQTYANGTGPAEALRATAAFSGEYDHKLSFLPGQRTSACTCSSSSSEHPGPNVNVGRSAPELDVLEAQVHNRQGQASQSLQIAPFDPNYTYGNTSATTTFYDPTDTVWNSYTGGAYQEAVSALSTIPDKAYEGYSAPEYTTFGMEYSPDYDGNGSGTVTWFIDGKATWHLTGASVGPRPEIDISQRLVPVEPMSIIMNLGISKGFQTVYFDELTFPAQMKVDYVRVYQRDGDTDQISCDPPNYPTAKYIENHLDLYMNPNYTVFPRDKYDWPANRLETSC